MSLFTPLPVDVTQQKTVDAFVKALPEYDRGIAESMLRMAQADLALQKAITPQAIQQYIDIYKAYGPQIAQIQARETADAQRAQVGADLETIGSPEGKALAAQGLDLAKQADPEFFGLRGPVSEKFKEALNASSAGVSPTERAELSRSIARSDPRTQGSALNTVENAMQFGSLATQKANNLAAVTSTISRALPSLKSGIDLFGVASGRGAPAIHYPTGPTGSDSAAGDLFAGTSNTAARGDTIRANRPSTLSQIGSVINTIGGLQGLFRSPNQGQGSPYSYSTNNIGGTTVPTLNYGSNSSFYNNLYGKPIDPYFGMGDDSFYGGGNPFIY